MSTLFKLAGIPQQEVGTCDSPPAGSSQSVAFSPAVPLFCDLNQPELSLEPLARTIRPTTKLQKSFGARMAQLSAILLSASWRPTRPPRWIKTKWKELLLRETLRRGVGLVRSGRHDRLQAAIRVASASAELHESSDTIAIMVHEAFRKGAPILAWILVKKLQHRYNVVVLLSAGGRLFSVFEEEAAAVVSLPQAMEGGPARVCVLSETIRRNRFRTSCMRSDECFRSLQLKVSSDMTLTSLREVSGDETNRAYATRSSDDPCQVSVLLLNLPGCREAVIPTWRTGPTLSRRGASL
jgi:hypothetical protein